MRIRIRPIYRLTRAIKAFFGPVTVCPRARFLGDIYLSVAASRGAYKADVVDPSLDEGERIELRFPKKFRIRCRKAWYELIRLLDLAEGVPGPQLAEVIGAGVPSRDPGARMVQRNLDGLEGVALAKGIETRIRGARDPDPRPFPRQFRL